MANKINCSFCDKPKNEVNKLIAGPNNIYICESCIGICQNSLSGINPKEKKVIKTDKLSPKNISDFLNQYVIGQEEAKMILSVAVYNHYKRITNKSNIELDKSNICLIGPSGSGKSHLAKTIARFLDVPFVNIDATSLTENGYIGEDTSSILSKLYLAAEKDISRTENGIVFIDEIDKIKKSTNPTGSRDISGEGVQQSLLKIIEGSEVYVSSNGSKIPGNDLIKINTNNILFICGGAFDGILDIIRKEEQKSTIGFSANIENDKNITYSSVSHDHLISYGLIPEFVGRLPIIAPLHELTEDQLIEIMIKPKNSIIKQFKQQFKFDEITLNFDNLALKEVAKMALKSKTGVRNLRSIFEKSLLELQYTLPELKNNGVSKVTISKGLQPIYFKSKNKNVAL